MRGWLVASLLLLGGCSTSGIFTCTEDADCGDDGRCEANGYCSFPDASCPSGRRFGVHAPEFIAKQCVEESLAGTDGDTDDATPSSTTDSATATSTSTTDDGPTSSPVPPPECGNDVVEIGEDCDGDEVDATCVELGHPGGTLACEQCRYDVSGCSVCGDAEVGDGEDCDGENLGGESCEALGFFTGSLACADDCTSFDTSGCTNCGNGVIDPGEICDGTDSAISCGELGYLIDLVVPCEDTCGGWAHNRCGPIACGVDPTEPFTDCPAACTSCAGDVCEIDCTGTAACDAMTLQCPPGWPCRVVCDGTGACSDAIVECPPYHECQVTCDGTAGCDSTTVDCGIAGICEMVCLESTGVCADAKLNCGADICAVVCQDPDGPTDGRLRPRVRVRAVQPHGLSSAHARFLRRKRLTLTASVSVGIGLMRYASASSAASMRHSAAPPTAVVTMIGTSSVDALPRIAAVSSIPFMPGISRSVITSAGR